MIINYYRNDVTQKFVGVNELIKNYKDGVSDSFILISENRLCIPKKIDFLDIFP